MGDICECEDCRVYFNPRIRPVVEITLDDLAHTIKFLNNPWVIKEFDRRRQELCSDHSELIICKYEYCILMDFADKIEVIHVQYRYRECHLKYSISISNTGGRVYSARGICKNAHGSWYD
jgi:hypothetical protein